MLRPQFIVVVFALLVGALCTLFNARRSAHFEPNRGLELIANNPIELTAQGNFPNRLPRTQLQTLIVAIDSSREPSAGIPASPKGRVLKREPQSAAVPQESHLPGSVSSSPSDKSATIQLEAMSAEDVALLHQLPMDCTAEIAGFSATATIPDHSNLATPVGFELEPSIQPTSALETEPIDLKGDTEETPHDLLATQEPLPVQAAESTGLIDASPSAAPAEGVVNEVAEPASSAASSDPTDPHCELYARTQFPSAAECAQCHQQIYDEWSASSHAYASISPMFQRFEDTISKLTSGTIGYFCMRCHAPVATTMEHPRDQAIYDGPRVFREGVTCVACHRVQEAYTKSNGERRIEPGDIFQPVFGGSDGVGNELAVKYKDLFKVKTSHADTSTAQSIHSRSIQFEQISQSDFCMSCHQVSVPPGIKLEVVWDQFRASPAYRAGVTCQDCHMGKVPGVDGGYSVGPAAVVAGRVVNPERKHSNHAFYGPGNSIAHPGLFPQDPRPDRWSPDQWLAFDWRAGWGTEEFERQIATDPMSSYFPEVWSNADDRYDAREFVESNLKKLQFKNDLRRQVLENGSKIEGPFFAKSPQTNSPLVFEYCLSNLNPGHNLPSGSLGAQPQLWLNVALVGPDGQPLWESGYLDSYGDLADIQSADVQCGRTPFDKQLFNLQTKFLTTNVKGTDREMYLPINFDIDQLPFIRPAAQPVTVINHPPGIRMEAHSLPPLGSRRAKYRIPADLIRAPGTYRLSVRLRSRMEPIYFMKFCSATPEMIRSMNESILDVHAYSVAFQVQ